MIRASREPYPNPVDFAGWDIELFFATEILRLRSLHYGYWEDPQKKTLTLKDLRQAQADYTQKLFSFIPDGIKTVLDVGAGIGDNARELLRRGYRVTALSPDKNHRRYFEDMPKERLTFHNVRFEDFESEERFDLVLLSESLNYFNWDIGLEQCHRYTKEGKYLLVAAIFRRFEGLALEEPFPKDKPFRFEQIPYVNMAASWGFVLQDALDITENVTPTLELIHLALQKYGWPLHMSYKLMNKLPLEQWFPGPIKRIKEIKNYYQKRVDPEHFRTRAKYAILLFQKQS